MEAEVVEQLAAEAVDVANKGLKVMKWYDVKLKLVFMIIVYGFNIAIAQPPYDMISGAAMPVVPRGGGVTLPAPATVVVSLAEYDEAVRVNGSATAAGGAGDEEREAELRGRDQVSDDPEIQRLTVKPNVGIGLIKFDMNRTDVKRLLGEPHWTRDESFYPDGRLMAQAVDSFACGLRITYVREEDKLICTNVLINYPTEALYNGINLSKIPYGELLDMFKIEDPSLLIKEGISFRSLVLGMDIECEASSEEPAQNICIFSIKDMFADEENF